MAEYVKQLSMISQCSDPVKLRNWIENAERNNADVVAEAARRRFVEVQASKHIDDTSDALVCDFWKSVIA